MGKAGTRRRRPAVDLASRLTAQGRFALRDVVPIVGAGVNLAAAAQTKRRKAVDWAGLLQSVIVQKKLTQLDAKSLPASFIQQWEAIVRYVAQGRDVAEATQASRAEQELQRRVAAFLADGEADGVGPIHHDIAAAGFRDIVSLNFDRHLALSVGFTQVRADPGATDGVNDCTLWRHTPLGRTADAPRVWYPHGDVRRAASIKLGVRRYGVFVDEIEELRKQRFAERSARRTPAATASPSARSWLDAVFERPLVFVGCSLQPDEWPLWWMLHQRARNHVRRPPAERPPVLLLSGSDVAPHLVGNPADVETVVFESFDALWGEFGRLLEAVAGA